MRFLVSLGCIIVELANILGKWLFIATAPVLLIVTASYYQAGKSCLEPLAGLALVSGVFAATQWLSLRMDWPQVNGFRNGADEGGFATDAAPGEGEFWNQHLRVDGLKRAGSKREARLNSNHHAELWRQTNPWGGYNPHE